MSRCQVAAHSATRRPRPRTTYLHTHTDRETERQRDRHRDRETSPESPRQARRRPPPREATPRRRRCRPVRSPCPRTSRSWRRTATLAGHPKTTTTTVQHDPTMHGQACKDVFITHHTRTQHTLAGNILIRTYADLCLQTANAHRQTDRQAVRQAGTGRQAGRQGERRHPRRRRGWCRFGSAFSRPIEIAWSDCRKAHERDRAAYAIDTPSLPTLAVLRPRPEPDPPPFLNSPPAAHVRTQVSCPEVCHKPCRRCNG